VEGLGINRLNKKMSIEYNNQTTKRGLVQKYEKALGMDYGDVSGNSELLAEFTANVNDCIDDYLLLWAKSAGTWQGDDINHTSYPIITRNIVSGTRDYDFTSDGSGNRIVDLQKVLILESATATNYVEITPIDELNTSISDILLNTNTGVPRQYGKLANAILLDLIPNYSVTAGIKMIVNREGSYVTTADTTKIIGVPAYHEYFYLKPAFIKAKQKSLSVANSLEKDVIDLEGSERLNITGKIQAFFSARERDVRKRLAVNVENTR
jgi:hypothetical protein